MTFSSLAGMIRKNEYFLTRDVVKEIRQTLRNPDRHFRLSGVRICPEEGRKETACMDSLAAPLAGSTPRGREPAP